MNGNHTIGPALLPDGGTQALEAPDGGGDVLGFLLAEHVSGLVRQGGADEKPVGRRLGGNGTNGAGNGTGLNGNVHQL